MHLFTPDIEREILLKCIQDQTAGFLRRHGHQKVLATYSGLSEQTLASYNNGRSVPTLHSARLLAPHLPISNAETSAWFEAISEYQHGTQASQWLWQSTSGDDFPATVNYLLDEHRHCFYPVSSRRPTQTLGQLEQAMRVLVTGPHAERHPFLVVDLLDKLSEIYNALGLQTRRYRALLRKQHLLVMHPERGDRGYDPDRVLWHRVNTPREIGLALGGLGLWEAANECFKKVREQLRPHSRAIQQQINAQVLRDQLHAFYLIRGDHQRDARANFDQLQRVCENYSHDDRGHLWLFMAVPPIAKMADLSKSQRQVKESLKQMQHTYDTMQTVPRLGPWGQFHFLSDYTALLADVGQPESDLRKQLLVELGHTATWFAA